MKKSVGNPDMKNGNHKTFFKSVDNSQEKMHKKSFSIKLPQEEANWLLNLPSYQRTRLIRTAIINEIKRIRQDNPID